MVARGVTVFTFYFHTAFAFSFQCTGCTSNPVSTTSFSSLPCRAARSSCTMPGCRRCQTAVTPHGYISISLQCLLCSAQCLVQCCCAHGAARAFIYFISELHTMGKCWGLPKTAVMRTGEALIFAVRWLSALVQASIVFVWLERWENCGGFYIRLVVFFLYGRAGSVSNSHSAAIVNKQLTWVCVSYTHCMVFSKVKLNPVIAYYWSQMLLVVLLIKKDQKTVRLWN